MVIHNIQQAIVQQVGSEVGEVLNQNFGMLFNLRFKIIDWK